jgi:hypothetical protein
VITYRAAPKPPKRGKCFSPFGFPLAFSTRASLAGYVSATTVTGWKACRFAVPTLGPGASGLQAAPFSKLSESPLTFLKDKITMSEVVKYKPGAGSKIPPDERWKTARLFARVVTRREGTAQRRDFAAIAVMPET